MRRRLDAIKGAFRPHRQSSSSVPAEKEPLPPISRSPSPPPPPAADAPPPYASPTPTTILDSTAFPHILDLVISHAPHASLLRLRATSRALRDRIDELWSAHLVVVGDEMWADGGRHPAFAPSLDPSSKPAVVFQPTPTAPGAETLPWKSWSRPRQTALRSNARVLDWMYHADNMTCYVDFCLSQGRQCLKTLRVWSPELSLHTLLATEILVVFGWKPPRERPLFIRYLYERSLPFAPWPPPSRIVLNWSMDGEQVLDMSRWMNGGLYKHLVIVFVPPPKPDAAAGSKALAPTKLLRQPEEPSGDAETYPHLASPPSDNTWRCLLQDILLPAITGRPPRPPPQITFVNTSAVPPLDTPRWRLFFPAQEFGPDVFATLQPSETLQSLVTTITQGLGDGPNAGKRSAISFLSLDEYAESVGRKQFMLETNDKYIL